ncbi:MAG: hypothetical protein ACRDT4_24485 [Micromonosporaceae bacterium]
MTEETAFYWCVKHSRVESGDQLCAVRDRLGPYPTREAAEHAMEKVKERNDEWEAEDARWEGR